MPRWFSVKSWRAAEGCSAAARRGAAGQVFRDRWRARSPRRYEPRSWAARAAVPSEHDLAEVLTGAKFPGRSQSASVSTRRPLHPNIPGYSSPECRVEKDIGRPKRSPASTPRVENRHDRPLAPGDMEPARLQVPVAPRPRRRTENRAPAASVKLCGPGPGCHRCICAADCQPLAGRGHTG